MKALAPEIMHVLVPVLVQEFELNHKSIRHTFVAKSFRVYQLSRMDQTQGEQPPSAVGRVNGIAIANGS
jgi:hypothetical protein